MKEAIARVSEQRLNVCSGCNFQSENRKRSEGYKSVRPDVHCTKCGCMLSAKTKCLSCSCPLGFWREVANDDEEEDIKKVIGDGKE